MWEGLWASLRVVHTRQRIEEILLLFMQVIQIIVLCLGPLTYDMVKSLDHSTFVAGAAAGVPLPVPRYSSYSSGRIAHTSMLDVQILCGRLGSPHLTHLDQPIASGMCCLCFIRFLDFDTFDLGTAICHTDCPKISPNPPGLSVLSSALELSLSLSNHELSRGRSQPSPATCNCNAGA